jgi:hypothetical protein
MGTPISTLKKFNQEISHHDRGESRVIQEESQEGIPELARAPCIAIPVLAVTLLPPGFKASKSQGHPKMVV